MTAAILQGVPATTLDTDIWLELPKRRYVKALDIAKKLGAEILARTVVALDDDTLVNFLYRIGGLKTFADEHERAEELEWLGWTTNPRPTAAKNHCQQEIHSPSKGHRPSSTPETNGEIEKAIR
jgi:hypothetical protein